MPMLQCDDGGGFIGGLTGGDRDPMQDVSPPFAHPSFRHSFISAKRPVSGRPASHLNGVTRWKADILLSSHCSQLRDPCLRQISPTAEFNHCRHRAAVNGIDRQTALCVTIRRPSALTAGEHVIVSVPVGSCSSGTAFAVTRVLSPPLEGRSHFICQHPVGSLSALGLTAVHILLTAGVANVSVRYEHCEKEQHDNIRRPLTRAT